MISKMLYKNGQDYLDAPRKSIAVFGMSGLGKSFLSNMLAAGANWLHYCVDYELGSRLLPANGVADISALTNDNLEPLSDWVGKPGRADKGGIPIEEYMRRQSLHRDAEIEATRSIAAARANTEKDFIADCSGSLCEIVGDDIANSELMKAISESALPVWLEGNASYREKLKARFSNAPKPMYYRPDFLQKKWDEYLNLKAITADHVDPDDFIRWGYSELIDDRQPRYAAMARHWGITLKMGEVSAISTPDDFNALIAQKLG